jgi:hypothetical protein
MNAPRIGYSHAETVYRASNAIAYENKPPRFMTWLAWAATLDIFGNAELAEQTDRAEWLDQNLLTDAR